MKKNTITTIKLGIVSAVLAYVTYYLAQLTYSNPESIGYAMGVLGAPVIGIFAGISTISFLVFFLDGGDE
jgi:hypothetical protein